MAEHVFGRGLEPNDPRRHSESAMKTTAEEYQYARGQLDEYRASFNQRMACAPTAEARGRLLDEGDTLVASMNALADRLQHEPARNSSNDVDRYDRAICSVRCVVFPSAFWTLSPRTAAENVGELHRVENEWRTAQTPTKRAMVANDAETLAERMGARNALLDLKSPGAILAEMNTTDEIIEQLGRDIDASRVEETFKSAWLAFAADWKKFFDDHHGWLDRLLYGAYAKTVEYRRRASDWRRQFEARGGKPSSPVDALPTVAGDSSIDWKKVALGAGIATGGVIALNALLRR